MLQLEHTYLELPQAFYSLAKPRALLKKKWVLYNEELEFALFPEKLSPKERLELCSGTLKECEGHIFAQAYAGHQFGHFTMLGDGRASVLGGSFIAGSVTTCSSKVAEPPHILAVEMGAPPYQQCFGSTL